jgi:hypothetical protein
VSWGRSASFLLYLPTIKKDCHDITEILLKIVYNAHYSAKHDYNLRYYSGTGNFFFYGKIIPYIVNGYIGSNTGGGAR